MHGGPVDIDGRALELAIEFAGADHLVAGSDDPHQIGSLRSMVESIGRLTVADDVKAGILGGNASRW